MAKDNYDVVVNHVIKILKNTVGKYLVKIDKGIYTFKSNDNPSFSALEDFALELKNYLVNNTPLELTWSEDEKFEKFYRERFFEPFMQPFHYKKYKFSFDLEVQYFKKLIHLFKCLTIGVSLSAFLPAHANAGIRYNPYHFEFLKEILSLDVDYKCSEGSDFWSFVRADLGSFENFYRNEDKILVKEGLINYLVNKKDLIEKYSDDWYETKVIEHIKNILHSDYWAEVASYVPVYYKNTQLKGDNDSIFSIGVNPVYYIDLNKANLLNASLTTLTDDDVFKMLSSIRNALNITKPEDIDKIEMSDPRAPTDEYDFSFRDIKIYFSGKNVNEIVVNKFIKLWEKMVVEYNGPNVDKSIDKDGAYERKKINAEYLTKVAETFWLDFELDGSKGKDKKVSKV